MAKEENGNGKTTEIAVNEKTARKIDEISERTGKTSEEVVQKAIHEHHVHHEVKEVLREACKDNRISSEKLCRRLENGQYEHRDL